CQPWLQGCQELHREIHVVMGNEACDLDSTVSALALSSPAPGAAVVPIDLAGLHRAGLLSLTLVDHHVLPGADAALEEAVVEVLDHRPLERHRGPPCQVTVEPVGSCATLVTERILQGPPGVLDRTTAALLHGTILLDCINLSPAAGKVTPRDVACVALLEERFPELPARDAVFGALQAAKFDVTGLTTEQMLRKDLKVISNDEVVVAISGIFEDLETFLLRPGLLQDLEAFCQRRGYAGLVAMTVSFNERHEPTRKLAVYSAQEPLRSAVSQARAPLGNSSCGLPQNSPVWGCWGGPSPALAAPQLCRALEEATTPSLLLQPLPSPWVSVVPYAQGNAVAARKKVLPILRAALGGLGAAGGPEEEVVPPPTPMNSLVEECPLAQPVPPLCPQDVLERVSRIAGGQPPGSPK
uniref:Prune exopolyphosphatase 1 n=1 Tax=Catharus ustulatus TaxID=91951 RepID=A0A8C3UVZ0_CATUS